jgi:hypothetical protein
MRNKKIKPFWIDLEELEDYKNGIYDNRKDKEFVNKCINLFKKEDVYSKMKCVQDYYPNATKVNLTNRMFNPIAWLGWATCNAHYGATKREVIEAWLLLTKEEQKSANENAKKVIEEYLDEII